MMTKQELEEAVNKAYDRLSQATMALRKSEFVLTEELFQLAEATARARHEGLIDGKNQQQRDAAERILLMVPINRVADCEVYTANAKLEFELATNERRRVDALLTIAQLQD